ncbi:MAG: hypothetical protein NC235_06905, partial [Clostridiales bacterium]|nr:hypothetical protein [Clostridiales bacterium]
MKMVKCPERHYYDSEKYKSCPLCAKAETSKKIKAVKVKPKTSVIQEKKVDDVKPEPIAEEKKIPEKKPESIPVAEVKAEVKAPEKKPEPIVEEKKIPEKKPEPIPIAE